jgi:transcription initiation factor TFIIE subunit alpha
MKEDDICDLLKFDKKMLRARITTLRNDKFIQVRLKMETGSDGKAQKVNYYFINYKVILYESLNELLVNCVINLTLFI